MQKRIKVIYLPIITIIGIIVVSFMIIGNIWVTPIEEDPSMEIKLTEEPNFLLEEQPTITALQQAIEYYSVSYEEIVIAQAILETGWFTSKVCKEQNNLFGLYDSRNKKYYSFDHWSDSVKAYKEYVQRKYKEGDYYEFLINLPYAMDPLYVSKLKNIRTKIYGSI